MMDQIRLVAKSKAIFFKRPIARVTIETCRELDGYRLVDVKDKHEWLRFGTDHSDSYYPWFEFNYYPKVAKP